jgi:hypothetical protein
MAERLHHPGKGRRIDPAYLLIMLMGAALAPVTMPQQIEHLCGVRADSEEFATTFAEQVRLLLEHLSRTPATNKPARAGEGQRGRLK